MPSVLLQLLAVGLVVLHLRAPLRTSIAVLLASTFLVPGALLVPSATSDMFVLRIGLWAAAVGIVLRVRRRELDVSALRPSRTLIALAGFVVVAYTLGVAAAPLPSRDQSAFTLWLLVVDQLLFLWVATVAVRAFGVRWVAQVAATLAVAVAVIGIAEHYLGTSYARWWFRGQADTPIGGQVLERRGHQQRVRGTGEFALQYAWVLGFFLPIVSVLAIRARHIVALAAPAVMGAGLVFAVTRSSYAGLATSAVILLVFARGDRRLLSAMLAAGVLAGFLYFGTSAVREPYEAADPESVNIRERRLSIITEELAPDPWFGIGLDGLHLRGIDSTDTTYLLVYAGAGVVGVTLLVGFFATAALTAGAGAVGTDDEDAALAAAVLGGVVSGVIAAFAFDSLSGPFSSWNLLLVVAMGVGLSERAALHAPSSPSRIGPSAWRLAIPLAGLAAGLVVAAVVPTHTAVRLRVFALLPRYMVTGSPNDAFVGRIIIDSTCAAAREALGPEIVLDCRDPLNLGPGTGSVRIEARTRAEADQAQAAFERLVPEIHANTQLQVIDGPRTGIPTWARTAPATATILATEAALLVPPLRLRRRRRS